MEEHESCVTSKNSFHRVFTIFNDWNKSLHDTEKCDKLFFIPMPRIYFIR